MFKIVFPALWITAFGAGTLTMWIVPSAQTDDLPVLEFTVAWVVGTVLLLALARGLRVVYLDGEWLWVSNFRRHIPIPLSEIESVEEIRWLNIHPIILNLNRSTEFGDRIVFMPKGAGVPFASHPLVRELEYLAEEARRHGDGG
jgi:hypothetical protein